jgi:hypothetical protein
MVKYKPRVGVGAKAKILARMIYPRQQVMDNKEEVDVILIGEEDETINCKQQLCYSLTINGAQYKNFALKGYVHVFEEGNEKDIFDPTLPGPPKDATSNAKKHLYEFLLDGTVPIEAKDKDGNVTISIEDI